MAVSCAGLLQCSESLKALVEVFVVLIDSAHNFDNLLIILVLYVPAREFFVQQQKGRFDFSQLNPYSSLDPVVDE